MDLVGLLLQASNVLCTIYRVFCIYVHCNSTKLVCEQGDPFKTLRRYLIKYNGIVRRVAVFTEITDNITAKKGHKMNAFVFQTKKFYFPKLKKKIKQISSGKNI